MSLIPTLERHKAQYVRCLGIPVHRPTTQDKLWQPKRSNWCARELSSRTGVDMRTASKHMLLRGTMSKLPLVRACSYQVGDTSGGPRELTPPV
jgi:hypothetical protein